MEDNMKTENNFLPALSSLYDGDGEVADIDQRYETAEVIADAGGSNRRSDFSVFQLLSAELNRPQYQIRTPEQQSEWASQKSLNVKRIGKYLLRLRCAMESLKDLCFAQSTQRLFGVFTTEGGAVDGSSLVSIGYDSDSAIVVGGLLVDYLNGTSKYTIDELDALIVDDYNLNYLQFIKPVSETLLQEFNVVFSGYEKYLSTLPKGSPLPLLKDKTNSFIPLIVFEAKLGLDWSTICTLMRNIKLLHLSSERLKTNLVCTNIRSCFSAAMNHYHKIGGVKNVNFDEKDLINEAVIGLMHAADMYVYGTSAKFTTYAEYWINLRVTRYSKNNNSVRIPVHAADMTFSIIKVLRAHDKFGCASVTLEKKDVEGNIKKKISDDIWQLAMNKYNGIPVSIGCVTLDVKGDGDANEQLSFDVFADKENDDTALMGHDAKIIMNKAKSLVDENASSKDRYRLTPEQYNILYLSFVSDLNNREIAARIGCESKRVKSELLLALEKTRVALGIVV
jgi:RNA polymerase sigma factor (sigma-70 family)